METPETAHDQEPLFPTGTVLMGWGMARGQLYAEADLLTPPMPGHPYGRIISLLLDHEPKNFEELAESLRVGLPEGNEYTRLKQARQATGQNIPQITFEEGLSWQKILEHLLDNQE